jgi:hypothetical protein
VDFWVFFYRINVLLPILCILTACSVHFPLSPFSPTLLVSHYYYYLAVISIVAFPSIFFSSFSFSVRILFSVCFFLFALLPRNRRFYFTVLSSRRPILSSILPIFVST